MKMKAEIGVTLRSDSASQGTQRLPATPDAEEDVEQILPRSLSGTYPADALSRTGRQDVSVVKPSSLWYFVDVSPGEQIQPLSLTSPMS